MEFCFFFFFFFCFSFPFVTFVVLTVDQSVERGNELLNTVKSA